MKTYNQPPKAGAARVAWNAIARTAGAEPAGLVFANETGCSKMWIGQISDGRYFGFDSGWGPQSKARHLPRNHGALFAQAPATPL